MSKKRSTLIVVVLTVFIAFEYFRMYKSTGELPLRTNSSESIKADMRQSHSEITKIAFSSWYGQNLKISVYSDREWTDEAAKTIITDLTDLLADEKFQEEYFKVYESRYGETDFKKMSAAVYFFGDQNYYEYLYMSEYPFYEWSVRNWN